MHPKAILLLIITHGPKMCVFHEKALPKEKNKNGILRISQVPDLQTQQIVVFSPNGPD